MLQQLTQFRMPDGTPVNFADWQDLPLYSSIDLLSNFTDRELLCFTYTLGDPVPATANIAAGTNRQATEMDTNIDSPGSMSSEEEMLVYSIRVEYIQQRVVSTDDPSSAAPNNFPEPTPLLVNIMELQNVCTLELVVAQKRKHHAPLGFYNTGFGVFASFGKWASGLGGTVSVASGGVPAADSVRSYNVPIHIGSQEKFRAILRNPDAAAVPFFVIEEDDPSADTSVLMTLRIYLDGLRKRPVA